MAKKFPQIQYSCNSCGEIFSRWAGKCESCGAWNSISELVGTSDRFGSSPSGSTLDAASKRKKLSRRYSDPIALNQVGEETIQRLSTGFSEVDLVLGGGVVPGSLVLIGGEPGVGKSTLVLEICREVCKKSDQIVLYISGEESSKQIGIRAERMGIKTEQVLLSSESYVENIREMIEDIKPAIVFVDSIQTVQREALPNQAGAVVQLRESTQYLLETAKSTNIPIFLIGHITKDGSIAGPKILEHLVDTVLYFEGDKLHFYRILRGIKNRFGAVGEIAIFEMHHSGLKQLQDRRNLFINMGEENSSGSVLSCVLEGSRALSVEVQALVSRTGYSQARRMAEGLDNRRLVLLSAVLEKFLGISLSQTDIFANLAGGLTAEEPALDLALCAAILSSFKEETIPKTVGFLGEVGLSGEVRSVGQLSLRLKELAGVGVKKILVPMGNQKEAESLMGGEVTIQGISHVKQLLEPLD